jgi:adenosine deaminase
MVARYADHPLVRLHRAGVRVTLSTDDRTVSGLTLPTEIARCVDDLGLTLRELVDLQRRAHAAAFLQHDEGVRARLAAELDVFLAAEPDLSLAAEPAVDPRA